MRKIGLVIATLVLSVSFAVGQTAPSDDKAKLTAANEALSKAFAAGNQAFGAKDYDAAILHYDTALKIYEQPPILSNKATALSARAVARFNAAVKMPDGAAKTTALDTARYDWKLAAEASGKAVSIARPANGIGHTSLLIFLKTHADVMRFVATKVDVARAQEAVAAFNEYFGLEKDSAALDKARLDQANLLLQVGEHSGAVLYFDTVLTKAPANIDANFGMASATFLMQDPTYFQRSANAAKKFLDLAPPTDPRRKDAQEILDYLKSEANIVPK
ncbi:MAG: hypothetical protein ABL984_07495 [Pyrinomonadaceae bacterium]